MSDPVWFYFFYNFEKNLLELLKLLTSSEIRIVLEYITLKKSKIYEKITFSLKYVFD